MHTRRTIFAQLMDYVSRYEFDKCVARYNGDHRVKTFTCWEQFLCMSFAQLTYRESLRDIEICLRAIGKKLYHIGIRSKISKSTLAYANDTRDWRIYQDFGILLITEAQKLYAGDSFAKELNQTAYALDATIISLCLSVFPWAKYMETKGGIKLHTQLDLHGNIPVFIDITAANKSELTLLDRMIPEPGAIYVMDRGYIDFKRLRKLHDANAYFIIRARADIVFQRIYSKPIPQHSNIYLDQVIRLTSRESKKNFPDKLRLVRCYHEDSKTVLSFFTNNFSLPATTIADLYRSRWQVELFFKWIKQHLRIKAFFGTSLNAVKTQIWIAISTYVLVAIIKKKLHLSQNLYPILQILSISLFENSELSRTLTYSSHIEDTTSLSNQLELFGS